MTIQTATQIALDCQDAVNLRGVLASSKGIVHDVIWPEARRLGKSRGNARENNLCMATMAASP